jgi:hypothetical protein
MSDFVGGRWEDLDPTFNQIFSYLTMMHPTMLVRAASVNTSSTSTGQHGVFLNLARPGLWRPIERVMRWTSDDGATTRIVTLRLYRLPTGASTITLGTKTVSSTTQRVTYTPSLEGYLISTSGVLVPTASAPRDNSEVAGLLLPKYVQEVDADHLGMEANTFTTLAAGDVCWVIVRGFAKVYASAAVTDEAPMNSSGATAGAAVDAPAIDTTSAATLHVSILKRRPLGATGCQFLGTWKETTGGAGLALAHLMLPRLDEIDFSTWRS